jgi:hypothetical protein
VAPVARIPAPGGVSPIAGEAAPRRRGVPPPTSSFASTASGGSRHGAVVIAQQTAEAFATRDRPSGIGVVIGRRGDQAVVEALVIALAMIVLDDSEIARRR